MSDANETEWTRMCFTFHSPGYTAGESLLCADKSSSSIALTATSIHLLRAAPSLGSDEISGKKRQRWMVDRIVHKLRRHLISSTCITPPKIQ